MLHFYRKWNKKKGGSMFFEYPNLLYLELFLIPVLTLYIWREIKGSVPAIRLSTSAPWSGKGGQYKKILRHLSFLFKFIMFAALIAAIARPRSSQDFEK